MRCTRRNLLASLLLICPVLAVIGCGPSDNKSKVSGTITYKGEGLKAGNIYLTSDAGGSYSSPIQPDGTYTITDVPIGNYIAIIETETINPDRPTGAAPGGKAMGAPQVGPGSKGEALNKEYAEKMGKMGGGGGDGGGGGGGGGGVGFGAAPIEELRKRYVKIPTKYGSKVTSGIVVEVTGSVIKKDIPLTD